MILIFFTFFVLKHIDWNTNKIIYKKVPLNFTNPVTNETVSISIDNITDALNLTNTNSNMENLTN